MKNQIVTITLLATTLTLSACGQFSLFGHKGSGTDRKVASAAAEQLIEGNEKTFSEELEEQLNTLHQYYIIGHKHLDDFDQLIKTKDLEEIYETDTYKSLLVIRELSEEIEDSIIEANSQLLESMSDQRSKEDKILALRKISVFFEKVLVFSKDSVVKKASMENLVSKFDTTFKTISWPKDKMLQAHVQELLIGSLKAKKLMIDPLPKGIDQKFKAEFEVLKANSDFEIQKKNVEHLSLMLDLQTNTQAAKITPSSGKAGNITGNEFPAKVWTLTFDDGPGKDSTLKILENLKKRDLKASFFQLAQQVKSNSTVAKAIKEAGMEIDSHSWSHLQLTKVGPTTLEKEITTATKEIEKFYDIDVKYFRLPYGAGVNTTSIREKIAENKLVHVFWNIDTLDWMSQTPDKIVTRTIAMMKKTKNDAGIILMHDIHARTAIASAEVMDYLKKDDRRACTIDEIVTQINEGAPEVCSKK